MEKNCCLSEAMTRAGMSQRRLAETVKCSQVALSQIITGKHLPRRPLGLRISEAVGVEFNVLWPMFEELWAERSQKIREGLKSYIKKRQHRKDKQIAYRAKYDMQKSMDDRAIRPTDPNAVPLADGAHADNCSLHPATATDDQLMDPRWCRTQARQIHDYLVRNCAYGVYQQLRGILAAENRLFEEREKAALAHGGDR